MYLLALTSWTEEKRALMIWSNTAKILLIILAILVFVPMLRSLIVF